MSFAALPGLQYGVIGMGGAHTRLPRYGACTAYLPTYYMHLEIGRSGTSGLGGKEGVRPVSTVHPTYKPRRSSSCERRLPISLRHCLCASLPGP